MNKLFTLVIFSFISVIVFAQDCDLPNAQIEFHGNDVKAILSTGADVFFDKNMIAAGFEVPVSNSGQPTYTIFLSNLWVGGYDDAGNLKMAAERFPGNFSFDWTSGPLDDFGSTSLESCNNWDRIWTVRKDEINDHIADYVADGVVDVMRPSIFEWPGAGNEFFENLVGFEIPPGDMAPFFDENNNNIYEPDKGEFPLPANVDAVNIPDLTAWWVFNDNGAPHKSSEGNPTQLEGRSTVYAYSVGDDLIDRTIFRSLELINKGSENLNDLHAGYWTDFDLGCHADDYSGCIPEQNTLYAYNQDSLDGYEDGIECGDVVTFGNNPPVQAITFLNREMTSFMISILEDIIDWQPYIPYCCDDPKAYYNSLLGIWPDGVPVTIGGVGYSPSSTNITKFMFPDNPNDPEGWSMYTETFSDPPRNRRSLGSVSLGSLAPNEKATIDVAYSFHQEEGNDNLENVDLMYDQIPALLDFREGITLAIKEDDIFNNDGIEIFPNPATDHLFIRNNQSDSRITSYKIFSVNGTQIKSEVVDGDKVDFDLEPGVYFIKFNTEVSSGVKKFFVSKK